MSTHDGGEAGLQRVRVVALGVAAAVVLSAGVWVFFIRDQTGFGLSGDGPLRGFDGAGTIIPSGQPFLVAGQPIVFGCQVLENLSTDQQVQVRAVELVINEGFTVLDGPFFWEPRGRTLVCDQPGELSELEFDDLIPATDVEVWPLDPGEQVAVYFQLRYEGTMPRAIVRGHLVDYTAAGDDYRELFEFQMVICRDEPSGECDAEPLIQSRD